MAVELKMPALSPTMEKGTLARWLVAEGDHVKQGDMIAEIETDKATMEFEAADEGRVASLVVPAGTEDVVVGTVLATLTKASEAVPKPDRAASTVSAREKVAAHVAAPATPAPLIPATGTTAAATASRPGVNATPLAQRIAAMRNIALTGVTGSGPHGRIVKADIGGGSLICGPEAAAAPLAAITPPPEGVPVRSEKLSSMRKTIARRLSESKSTVPHFYLTARCNLDSLLALRAQLNEGLAAQGIKLSVNDMLMKALAVALLRVPEANVRFGGNVLHRFERVDVSMAVAIDGGLVTPVIRDVAAKTLSCIASESQELSRKAREGGLTPEDYAGGTVSLSNLGMYGIDEMFPVINPPQALILGTAAGARQPWNVDGQIKLANVMAATASFDHRAIDGAIGARFMAAFKALIEQPLEMLA